MLDGWLLHRKNVENQSRGVGYKLRERKEKKIKGKAKNHIIKGKNVFGLYSVYTKWFFHVCSVQYSWKTLLDAYCVFWLCHVYQAIDVVYVFLLLCYFLYRPPVSHDSCKWTRDKYANQQHKKQKIHRTERRNKFNLFRLFFSVCEEAKCMFQELSTGAGIPCLTHTINVHFVTRSAFSLFMLMLFYSSAQNSISK